MDPFAIFPDDLEDDYLPAANAAMQAMSERASYNKKSRRDYRIAYSMVNSGKVEALSLAASIPDSLPSVMAPVRPTAFVPSGVVEREGPSLDTSGVSSFLSGTSPDGAHLFELSFNEDLLGGLRCSLSTLNGVVTATFHAGNRIAAKKLEEQLPRLRQMFEKKGLKIDQLRVEIN